MKSQNGLGIKIIEKSINLAIICCMPKDIDRRIDKIEELVEENNEMLHKIRKKQVLSFWFNILKILVFLGVFYYGYVLLQPYLQQLFEIYTSIRETADTAAEIKDNLNVGVQGFNLQELLGQFQGS